MPIIVTNNFPPSLGGIQTMMLELAIGLHERGLHVAVVAPDAPQAHDVDQELPYQVVRYRGLRRPFELLAILSAVMTVRKRSPKTPYLASAWWPVGLALAVLPLRMRGPLVIFGAWNGNRATAERHPHAADARGICTGVARDCQ